MTTVSRTRVHQLVSHGWDPDDEALDFGIVHPDGCEDHNAFCPDGCTEDHVCEYGDWLDDCDYTRSEHLRQPGEYLSYITVERDYFGEHDSTVHENTEDDSLVFVASDTLGDGR